MNILHASPEGDRRRARWVIVMLLIRGPKIVGELQAALDVDPTLLSHHLQILKDEGLIASNRTGKNIRYSLAPGLSWRLEEAV